MVGGGSATDYRYTSGAKFGRWRIIEPFGKGANAEVWRAERAEGDPVALKILYAEAPEARTRFRREVDILRRLHRRPGVLPLLESDVPPSGPPWYAMPIATPITKRLGEDPPLEAVVNVICEAAETLVEALPICCHRDIKPANLYWHDDRCALADFGYAQDPGVIADAGSDELVGTLQYIAPELIHDPNLPAAYPADVYSLAKTLWVLAAHERNPLGGQLLAPPDGEIPRPLKHEPRWPYLAWLLEAATSQRPDSRPSMDQVAGELRLWSAGELGDSRETIRAPEPFWRTVRNARMNRDEYRAVQRAIYMLAVTEDLPDQNARDLDSGEQCVDVNDQIVLIYEEVDGTKTFLACFRNGPTLWDELER